ncbi:MAG: UbiA family prenyltransferase [Methanomicrobiales archaeon]|nr:UbiA family prenyltransferase [Methanomicrobiales archaeon]
MTPEGQAPGMREVVKAYLDLTRAHFAIVWPVLALSGLALASTRYGGLSWILAGKVALAALFGFEAGMVLNDIVDRRPDTRDIDPRMTRYWRPFGTRPLAAGTIPPSHALALFALLVLATGAIILTLPWPHSGYVGAIMAASYGLEAFYQLKKRDQRFPVAQLAGRIDLALFPVAGYLALGFPDITALLLFLVFYPWAEAHLGVNDLADVVNDRERGMKTIPVLFGTGGCIAWITLFSLVHVATSLLLLSSLGILARAGFLAGFLLLLLANLRITRHRTPEAALGALPLFHGSLFLYAAALILGSVL